MSELSLGRLKELFRLTSIYSIGKIGVAVIGFALYPVYTQYLTPAQFGIIGLAVLVGSGSRHLFSLGTRAAAFNFYHRYEGEDREVFYTTLFVFITALSLGWLLVLEAVGPVLFQILFEEQLYDPYIRIVLLATALTATFHLIPKQRFRAAERAQLFVGMDLATTLTRHSIGLVAVIILSFGVTGYLLGQLAGAALVGLAGLVVIGRRMTPRLSAAMLRETLVYSLPMFPHFYSHFVISMADRVLLSQFSTLEAVGIYTIGYTLASALRMFISAANSAIMPEFARANEDDTAFDRLADTSTYYLLFAAVVTVGFSLFMPMFINSFFSEEYHGAISILPWLALGFFSVALYLVPMNVLSQTQRETRIVPILTIAAAASNIGLNLLLIPPLGIVGAAISTLGAYLLLATLVFLVSQRYHAVEYQYRRVGMVVASMVTIVGAEIALPRIPITYDILVRTVLLVLFFLILTGVGFWTDEERQIVRQVVADAYSRL